MHMKKVDLAKITLGLLFLSLLIISCFMVLRPFLPALVWATMITIATWPLMQMAQRLLWGKRALAALDVIRDDQGQIIGLAYAGADQAEPGSLIPIRVEGGQVVQARVVQLPFYDPDNQRQEL